MMNGKSIVIAGALVAILTIRLVHHSAPEPEKVPSGPMDKIIAAVAASKGTIVPAVALSVATSTDRAANQSSNPPPQIAEGQTNGSNDFNPSDTGQQLIKGVIAWAAKDPDAALQWVLKMPGGDDRNETLQAVCSAIAQKDPARAVGLAQTLEQPSVVVENLAQQWAARDVLSALTWADSQPPGEERDHLVQRVAFVLSQTDPGDAADLVLKQIPPGSAQDDAVMTVIHQWGLQNLQAAAAWALTLPSGLLQERATRELEGIQRYQKL